MKTRTIIILLATLILIVGVVLVSSSRQPSSKNSRIGFIGPLTGDASQWGVPPKEGVELATSEWKTGNVPTVFFEDDQCDPKKAVTAAKKLIEIDRVQVIIGAVCSSATLAIAPLAESNQVLLISPASTNPDISKAGDFLFRVVPSDALRGEVFAKYLREEKKLSQIDLLTINNAGGIGNRDVFKKTFASLDGKVSEDLVYDEKAVDFKTELLRIKNSPSEAVVVVSYPEDTTRILKQLKEFGINKPLYFQTEAPDDPIVLQNAGSAAEGITYILPAPAVGSAPESFQKKFKDTFGKEPSLFAAEGYDIVKLLEKIIAEEKTTNPTRLKNALYEIQNYTGASGTITFDNNGDVMKPMAIMKIEHGQKILVTRL